MPLPRNIVLISLESSFEENNTSYRPQIDLVNKILVPIADKCVE